MCIIYLSDPMTFSLVFFIIIHALAFIYFLEIMRRVRQRTHEYPLKESVSTLPFGFIRLRHLIVLYTLFYIVWILVSLWFYVQWLRPGSIPDAPPPPETILNL